RGDVHRLVRGRRGAARALVRAVLLLRPAALALGPAVARPSAVLAGRLGEGVLGALTVRAAAAVLGLCAAGGVGGPVLGGVVEIGHVHHGGDRRTAEQQRGGGAHDDVPTPLTAGRDRAAQPLQGVRDRKSTRL